MALARYMPDIDDMMRRAIAVDMRGAAWVGSAQGCLKIVEVSLLLPACPAGESKRTQCRRQLLSMYARSPCSIKQGGSM